MSAFREPLRHLSHEQLMALDADTNELIAARFARGGGVWLDYAPGPWPDQILTPYWMMRGDLTEREWLQVVAEARATIAHAEALRRALEQHTIRTDARATALAGPLA